MQNLKDYLIYESAGLFKGQLDLTNICFLNIFHFHTYDYLLCSPELKNVKKITINNKDIPNIDCFFEKIIFEIKDMLDLNGDLAFDESNSPYNEKTKKLKYITIYVNEHFIKKTENIARRIIDKDDIKSNTYKNALDRDNSKITDSEVTQIMLDLHSSLIHELNHAYNHYNTYFKNSRVKINDSEIVDKYIKRTGLDPERDKEYTQYIVKNLKKNVNNVSFYVENIIDNNIDKILNDILYFTHPVETKAFNSMLISFKKFYSNNLEEAKNAALNTVKYNLLIFYKNLLTNKEIPNNYIEDDIITKSGKLCYDDFIWNAKDAETEISDIKATYNKAIEYIRNNKEDIYNIFIKCITENYNKRNETNLSSNKVVKNLLNLISKTTKKIDQNLNKIFKNEIIDSDDNKYIYDFKNYKLKSEPAKSFYECTEGDKDRITDIHLLINGKEYKPIYTFKNKKITKK